MSSGGSMARWSAAVAPFLVVGAGAYSVDALLGRPLAHAPQRERHHLRLAVRIGHHTRGTPSQPMPLAGLDHLIEEREVLTEEQDVRTLAALEESLHEAIDAVEVVLEAPPRGALIEPECLR